MSWSLPQRKAQIGLGTSRSDVELKPCNYVLAETYLSVFIFESFYFIPGRRKYNMLVEEEKRHVQSTFCLLLKLCYSDNRLHAL